MAIYSCFFRNPLSSLVSLGSLFSFTHSTSFVFLTIFLTSTALILSPLIIYRSWRFERKSVRKEEEISEKLTESTQSETQNESEYRTKVEEQEEEVSELKKRHKEEEKTVDSYLLRSSETLLSDSESQDQSQTTLSDDYSENDSLFREFLSNGTNYSDGSISDEESLIEIELPTGHYVGPKKSQERAWYGFQQKWADCSLESRFRQQNWMDMLSDMNEENFIEFDICMGSIKCSRFEIEA